MAIKIEKGTFAERLDISCDQHTDIPPHGSGRQVYLAKLLGVSPEAIRKYFVGEAKPRGPKLAKLAKHLGCDPEWLQHGTTPLVSFSDREEHREATEAIIHFAFGSASLQGATCAFPPPGDPCHLMAIRNGKLFRLVIAKGRETPSDTDGQHGLTFDFPPDTTGLTCIGVYVPPNKPHAAEYLHFTPEILQKCAKVKVQVTEIEAVRKGKRQWVIGEDIEMQGLLSVLPLDR